MSIELKNKVSSEVNIQVLSDNLRLLMNQRAIDTAELFKQTGIAATTINNLKKGMGNPTLSTLQVLAEFFGISVGQLTESSVMSAPKNISSAVEIPLLELHDISEFLSQSNPPKKFTIVELDHQNTSDHFAIKMSNNSLAPVFEKGTIFVVCRGLMIRDGDIALVQFNQHLPCLRKVFIEDETYFFSQVSEVMGRELIKSKNFVILGVVTKAIQNFID